MIFLHHKILNYALGVDSPLFSFLELAPYTIIFLVYRAITPKLRLVFKDFLGKIWFLYQMLRSPVSEEKNVYDHKF